MNKGITLVFCAFCGAAAPMFQHHQCDAPRCAPTLAPTPTPHVADMRERSIMYREPMEFRPVTQVTTGTTIEVPAGTLNLQGFAPTVRVS